MATKAIGKRYCVSTFKWKWLKSLAVTARTNVTRCYSWGVIAMKTIEFFDFLTDAVMENEIAYEQYKQFQFHLQLREFQLTGNASALISHE